MLFCATSWRYMTRLLKTAIIGCTAARVDSSRIDMLAGLSKCWILRTPPCFWAEAEPAASNSALAAAIPQNTRFMAIPPATPVFGKPFQSSRHASAEEYHRGPDLGILSLRTTEHHRPGEGRSR